MVIELFHEMNQSVSCRQVVVELMEHSGTAPVHLVLF